MAWTLYGLAAYRCTRCFALFVIPDTDATYGPEKEVDILLANACACCGKGTVEPIGTLYYRPSDRVPAPQRVEVLKDGSSLGRDDR